jgi:hypothetical protein
MAIYKVCLTGYFSNELDVEFESDENGIVDDVEIEALAISLFEESYYPSGKWAESWDFVEIDSIQEVE